jgi:putative ABC transport system substrate-binding protein
MKKVYILIVLVLAFAAVIGVWARYGAAPEKHYVIGVLNYTVAAELCLQGFKDGMHDAGYIEGNNITYIYNGIFQEKTALMDEGRHLLENKVDLILAMSTPASMAAKAVTADSRTPVVFGPVNDPVGSGIVDKVRKADSHVTGVFFGIQEVKRLEWMVKLKPEVKRIFVLYNPKDRSPQITIKKLQKAAGLLGVELVLGEASDATAIAKVLDAMPEDIDALYMPTDSLMATHIAEFVRVATKRRLPLSTPHRPGVEQGALYSYGFDHIAVGRQMARLADQILRGIPPSDLPVESAELFLSINVTAAESIDLEISDDILRQSVVLGR